MIAGDHFKITFPHVDWSITQACNYSCHYCHATNINPTGRLPVEHLHRELKQRGGDWTVTISGGEPFIHPDFVRSCQVLAQDFDLIINTNLTSSEALREFIRFVPHDRIQYLDISLHIEERLRRPSGVQNLIDNIRQVEAAGIPYIVNYVLHPSLVSRVEADIAFFKRHGIELVTKRFKGTWQGDHYPSSYGEREIRLMQASATFSSNKTYYDFLGVPCRAGMDLVKIKADGACYRCPGDKSPYGRLGNLMAGTFRPLTEATTCNVAQCPCWGPENAVLNDVDKLFLTGVDAVLENDLTEAQRAFEAILQTNPRASHARYNLGLVLWRQGHHQLALSAFGQAHRLLPGKDLYRDNYARALYLCGDRAAALALRPDPQLVERMRLSKPISAQLELCVQFRPRPDSAGWQKTVKRSWLKLLGHPMTGTPVKKFAASALGGRMLQLWRRID